MTGTSISLGQEADRAEHLGYFLLPVSPPALGEYISCVSMMTNFRSLRAVRRRHLPYRHH